MAVRHDLDQPESVGWDAILSDGGLVHLRPVVASDAPALRGLHRAASDRSLYLRFFTVGRSAAEQYVDRLLALDSADRLALVAEQHGAVIGMADCERLPGTADAEVAFLVADAHQGRGVGTLLLEHLAALARRTGVRRFVAETLADNATMLRVFADAGFPVDRRIEAGEVSVAFPIAPTEQAQAAVDARERAADVRSLRRVLAPRSVAVVGASDRPGSIGGAILRNVLAGGFTGRVHPVNHAARSVAGLPAYPSVADLPEPVDLAVVAVPAAGVAAVIDDCGRRGVPAAVLVTAGFGETGSDGVAAERELRRRARLAGLRLVGPNCLGVASTDPDVRLDATFGRTPPVAGSLGFASQSGALGIALLAETARRGLGVSGFVSLGNKVDVSGNDLLLYWEDDPRTRVIALYLESFGNPRKFARHAARVSRRKPIVALKSGRSASGGRAGASHTAAAATPDAVVGALLAQSGVIRVDTTAELLDVAALLSDQPLPAGSRLGVLGNSGGPGILAADAAEGAGLSVPELSPGLQAALREAAPRLAAAANPVDLGAGAGPEQFEATLRLLLDSGEVEAVVAIYAAAMVAEPEEVAAAIRQAAGSPRPAAAVPVAAALLGTDGSAALRDPAVGLPAVPMYDFPEAAVRAFGHAAWHARWHGRPAGVHVELPAVDVQAARTLVVGALDRRPDGCWLDAAEAAALLAAFGVPVLRTVAASTAEDALAAADRVGYPVALKAAAGVVHKTEAGGVRLGLADAAGVRDAFAAVDAAGGHPGAGVVVQPMAAPGVELLVGANRIDPYPPLLLVGLGGTATDLLADRCVRLAPLTDLDAAEMISGLRAYPLLTGYRGAARADVAAVEQLLLRVSALVDEVPELVELDLNPVVATPAGCTALDVKVRLAPVPAGADLLADPLARRLR